MSQKVLNIASVVFSVCSFTFFIVGLIGYATDRDSTKNVAWLTVDDGETGTRVWANLAQFYYKSNGMSGVAIYANSDCGMSFCNECAKDGDAAFGLLIVATAFASFTLVLSGILSSAPNATFQAANVVLSFITGCFSLIGFGIFMGSCYTKIDNELEYNTHYGPGAILTLLGLLMAWVTVFFQIGAVAVGSK